MRKTLYDALEKTAGAAGENTTEMTDKEKLRLLMRSTLDNINLSEQIARRTGDDDVRLAARIAARKDKETMDKLQAVLKRIDVDKFPVEPAKEYVDGSIQKKANIDLPIKLGDIILGGKYKNRREVVETIDWDELGQPVVNGKKLLTVRIEKKLPKRKWSAKTLALIKKASEDNKENVMNKDEKKVDKKEVMKNLGPLGMPVGTGQKINQAAGKPGLGRGRTEGREGRVRALKAVLESLGRNI